MEIAHKFVCKVCGRGNLTEKELDIHTRYFHKTQKTSHQQPQRISSGVCPDCGSTLWHQEGCTSCPSCGYSKCG